MTITPARDGDGRKRAGRRVFFVSHDSGDPLPLGAFWRGCSRTGRVLAVFRFCRLEWACKRFRNAEGSCGVFGGFTCELWRGENRRLRLADQACSEPVQRAWA